MSKLTSWIGSFDRLSARERVLVGGAGVLFVGILLAGVILWVAATLSSLEDEVNEGRDSLRVVASLIDDYRTAVRTRDEIQRIINENQVTSLRIPINNVARRVDVTSDDPRYTGNGKRLSDLISYSGGTVDTRIESKDPKKARRTARRKPGEEEGGNFEIEQTLEFADIPVTALYQFFAEFKRSEELLFVRRIDVSRRFNNLEHVRATLSVSTIRYREPESQ